MKTEESGTRRETRGSKRPSNSEDPREPGQLPGLEVEQSGLTRQEGAEALLAMAGIRIEPPTKMYRRDKNEREREVKEAQVNDTEASLEANYGDTCHESIRESLDLLNIDVMVKMLAAQDTLESGEGQM